MAIRRIIQVDCHRAFSIGFFIVMVCRLAPVLTRLESKTTSEIGLFKLAGVEALLASREMSNCLFFSLALTTTKTS